MGDVFRLAGASSGFGFGCHASHVRGRRRLMGAFIGVAVGLASMAHADPGDDATRSAARKVAMAGITALQQGDVAQATEKLEKAYRVLQVPSVALWSARALAKRGRLVEASERYGEASRLDVQGDKAVQLQARKDAATELEALTRRIPTLLILVEGANGADVKLKVDGAAVPSALIGEERPANPGQHRVSGDLGRSTSKKRLNSSRAASGPSRYDSRRKPRPRCGQGRCRHAPAHRAGVRSVDPGAGPANLVVRGARSRRSFARRRRSRRRHGASEEERTRVQRRTCQPGDQVDYFPLAPHRLYGGVHRGWGAGRDGAGALAHVEPIQNTRVRENLASFGCIAHVGVRLGGVLMRNRWMSFVLCLTVSSSSSPTSKPVEPGQGSGGSSDSGPDVSVKDSASDQRAMPEGSRDVAQQDALIDKRRD